MNSKQPNFEVLKTAFYRAFNESSKATNHIMMQSVKGMDFRPFNHKLAEFKKDLNKWLDGMDIRQSGTLIDVLKEHEITIPKWMASKQFYIDYNNNECLDLIRIENDY